jgi:zinc protease
LLADLLAGGDTALLYRSLVVEQGLAAGAECSYRGTSLDGTSFQIYATPRQVSDMDRLEAALDERLRHLLQDGVQADEVARVKRRMVAEAVYARDSLSGAARIIGAAVTTGRRVEDVERWPERIAAVTIEQVDAAARAVLRPEQSVTGRLLPSDRPGQTGEGVGA